MGFKFNPFTSNFDVDTDTGIVSMGDPISGADPNSVLISDSSSNLADVPLSTGQLLIGRTANTPIAASLTGTTNQVVVTNGSGSVTLSLPQSIATSSSPSFANVSIAPSGALDTSSSGTLSIGPIAADTINIGHSGSAVTIAGSTLILSTTDVQIVDKIITLNKNGIAGSGSNAGIEIEENSSSSQGFVRTSADRNNWNLKAPNTSGQVSITPGSSGFILNQGSHDPVTLGIVGSSPNTNAASLSTQVLTLQPADGSNPGLITAGTQTIGGNKTFNGSISASNFSGASSGTNIGDITLTAVGSSPSANGATLSSQALTLQPADATHPGLLTSGSQTIGGAKTFSSTISASNLSGTNTGDVTLGTASGLSLASQVLSLALSSASTTGSLTSTDWNTFNNKQNSVAGDIAPATWNGLVNNTANQTITGLLFSSSISSFETLMNINITATSNTYTTVKLLGTRKAASDWSVNAIQEDFSGDAVTGLLFNITSAGQVQASIGNIAGFASGVVKFRAITV